jgi:hypothetical protein
MVVEWGRAGAVFHTARRGWITPGPIPNPVAHSITFSSNHLWASAGGFPQTPQILR